MNLHYICQTVVIGVWNFISINGTCICTYIYIYCNDIIITKHFFFKHSFVFWIVLSWMLFIFISLLMSLFPLVYVSPICLSYIEPWYFFKPIIIVSYIFNYLSMVFFTVHFFKIYIKFCCCFYFKTCVEINDMNCNTLSFFLVFCSIRKFKN